MKSKNGKPTKKISLLAIIVALICMTLAVSFMANEAPREKGDACYVKGDLNGDGEITKSDALYLLYHSIDPEAYPLAQNGNFDEDNDSISGSDAYALFKNLLGQEKQYVHMLHGTPDWVWTEGENGMMHATAEYTCACGKDEYMAEVSIEVGTVEKGTKVLPTCTENGSITYVATTDLGDKSEYTVVLQATGHAIDENAPACMKQTCGNGCGYVKEAEAHTLSETFTEQSVDGKCTFKEVFTCTACNAFVDGKTYEKHTFTSKLTKEATCTHAGEKTYTCTVCKDEKVAYKETVPVVADAHSWNEEGVPGEGIITYTCKENSAHTKTAIVAVVEDNKATATVGSTALKSEANELEFQDAAIKLDESTKTTLGKLSKEDDVQISIETTNADALTNLDPELKDQIGTNTVYNFSMKSGETNISELGGAITITVPYTLKDTDDVDCIDIWFVNDNGQVEVVNGKYNNGYVTFTTNHFSYYTVTRLTPKQRCDVYGHVFAEKTVAPTCENDGYINKACTRCGHTEKATNGKATGHAYEVITENKVTCTEAGFKKEKCKNCNHVIDTVTAATGHDYAAPVEVKETCETRGYTSKECTREGCDHKDITYTSAVAGHAYEAEWSWAKDGLTAEVTLTCKRTACQSAPVTVNAVVSIQKQIGATCSEDGYVLYAAGVQHNGVAYADTYKVIEKQLQHKVTNEWKYNQLNHYKECTTCGGKVNEAAHTLGNATVTVAPTCLTTGTETAACTCGYVHTTELPALGHNVVNEDCTRCDFTTNTCDHNKTSEVYVDLSAFCQNDYSEDTAHVIYTSCECGRNAELNQYSFFCDFDWKVTYTTDKNGYTVEQRVGTCKDCGLQLDETGSWEVNSDCIGTSHIDLKVTDKNGKVLVDFEGVFEKNVAHPQVVFGTTQDLTDIGLCHGTATPTTCVCGKYKSTNLNIDKCQFEWLEDESDEDKSVSICRECNIKVVSEYTVKAIDKCHYEVYYTESFYKDKTKLASYPMTFLEENHDCDYKAVLSGTKCTDGLTMTYECKNCDYKESYYSKPESCEYAAIYQEIDVSAYNLCVDTMEGSVCPCGSYSRIWNNGIYEDHNVVEEFYEYKEDDGIDTCHMKYSCKDCDLIYESTEIYRYSEDSCEIKHSEKAEYRVKGNVIFTELYSEMGDSHNYEVLSYHLEGTSCADGGYVVLACKKCGNVEKNSLNAEWGHPMYVIGAYDLADYGLCGGHVEVYSCPCGEEQWINEWSDENEPSCDWIHYSYDPETETSTFKCADCGLYRQRVSEYELIEGCLYNRIEKYDYMNDYEILLSAKATREEYMHNDSFVFELVENGKTCSDGFTVTATCKDCKETRSWTDRAPQGEHYTFQTLRYDLTEYGFCGGEIWFWECPCGEEKGSGYNIWSGCDWQWISRDNATGLEWYKCRFCDAQYSIASDDMGKVGCMQYEEQVLTFVDPNGKTVISFTRDNMYPSHNNDTTFTFDGPVDCEGGYYVVETCKDCGNVSKYHEQAGPEWHYTYRIEIIDVGSKGLCSGEYVVYQCPCGENKGAHLDTTCDMRRTDENYETQTFTDTCQICEAKQVVTYGKETVVGCKVTRDKDITIYNKAGEIVLSRKEVEVWDRHDYEVLSYSVNDGNCMNGYTEELRCKDCGYTQRNEGQGHETRLQIPYDLASYGVCTGTKIVKSSCYCGEYESAYVDYDSVKCKFNNHWNSYVDDYGVKHEVDSEECTICGLKIVRDRVRQPLPDCRAQVTVNMMITVNGNLVDNVFYTSNEPYHDTETTCTLMPGSTNCEQGVYETYSCKNCDYSWTNTSYGHMAQEVAGSRIDLSQYGSICGAYMVQRKCVCGQYNNYEMIGECDLGYQSITPWLGQYYDPQETTEGWIHPAYQAWDVKCAVTSPKCNLSMRKCEYSVWDKATCTMQEYVVWQFGYDAATGKCDREIVIKDETYAYHAFGAYVETTQTTADGGRVELREQICSTCNSSNKETHTYDAQGNLISHEWLNTNTLSNGENISQYDIWTYITHNGYQYDKEWYHVDEHADSTKSWSRTERTYDWDNFDCTCTMTETSSYQTTPNVSTVNCHRGWYKTLPNATQSCTQPGHEYYVCDICGETDMDDYVHISPFGHWYDNGKCVRCGLESVNEADGSIVLEDFTSKYGKGTHYVIGFWNRNDIEFINNVSIVTSNGDVVILGVNNFTVHTYEKDGYNGISISIAEVNAAAASAGVSGDVRIAFVPSGNGSDLDYAITLTK